MVCRCPDVGLDEIFDEDFARGDANRYRKRGLRPRARKLLQLIEENLELRGTATLEAGAGAGGLTIELARRGAAQARGVDAIPVAVEQAQRLAHEFGVQDRVDFAVADFAEKSNQPAVDLVILDRVVCCYPDWTSLLENAAGCARQVVALSYPANSLLSRALLGLINTGQALLRRRFRLYLHSPDKMLGLLSSREFSIQKRQRYWVWELAVARRP